MTDDERRAALAAVVGEAPRPGQLAEACLLVARGEYPELEGGRCVDELVALAADVRAEAADQPWRALRAVLGEREGFAGDLEDYDAPPNSYLSDVLVRRRGLPILLSVVWLEVARAAGFDARGIGLPGHFIVSVGEGAGATLVDPFRGGRRMTPDEALARGAEALGDPELRDPEWLRPVGPRKIVRRILANLAAGYARRGDDRRTVRILSDMLALDPDAPELLVRRGQARARLRDVGASLADLNRALGFMSDGPAARRVVGLATRVAHLGLSLN